MNNLDDKFGAWLKIVLPDSGIAERDQRLNIIREFVATVNKKDILSIVLAFYSAADEQPSIERFRSAMHKIDTSFGTKDDAELSVLSAGVLFEILEQGGDLGAAAALTVLCADFGALSDNNHITELVGKAHQSIDAEGISIREGSVALPDLGQELRSAMELDDEGDENGAEEAASEPQLHRVVDVLADYGKKVQHSLASVEARRSEQSDILYWLLSGRRHIAGILLKSLKKEEAALFIAAELASLTRQIPGPASASAILSTLLDQCKKTAGDQVTLEACIQSIDAADGAKYLAKRAIVHPVISPISFALVKAEETGWQDGWQHAVKVQTKKAADTKYSVLAIAEQLYRETLLSRALGEN